MINLNGKNCDNASFDWCSDSGFRYGYGCFETMLCINGQVPLFDYHYQRLSNSLTKHQISSFSEPSIFVERIQSLYKELNPPSDRMICRIYVTGGSVTLTPGFDIKPNEIITFQSIPATASPMSYEFRRVTPTEFYKMKSMNYAHHLIELRSSEEWPIYVDHENYVIDSTIFCVGVILDDRLIFAKHEFQLPSVSRTFFLDQAKEFPIFHKELKRVDLMSATAVIGCNALHGLFIINGSQCDLNHKLKEFWSTTLETRSQ